MSWFDRRVDTIVLVIANARTPCHREKEAQVTGRRRMQLIGDGFDATTDRTVHPPEWLGPTFISAKPPS